MFTKSFEFRLAINIDWNTVSSVRISSPRQSAEYVIVLTYKESGYQETLYATPNEKHAKEAFNWLMQQVPSADDLHQPPLLNSLIFLLAK